MSKDKELLEDAMALLVKIKNDRKVWNGEVGLSPCRREDITELLRRHQAQQISKLPRNPNRGDNS